MISALAKLFFALCILCFLGVNQVFKFVQIFDLFGKSPEEVGKLLKKKNIFCHPQQFKILRFVLDMKMAEKKLFYSSRLD